MAEKRTHQKPVDWDQLYPGRFLKSGELLGKKVTVKIADIALEDMETDDGRMKVHGIIFLANTDKQLALNKTNGLCLKAMFGRKLADWTGKRITLQADKTKFGKDTVDCIRIHGSPDIERDMQVTINLPRKKPFQMTMVRTVREAPAAQPAEQPPPQNDPPPEGATL
jgi:hypothetical protein